MVIQRLFLLSGKAADGWRKGMASDNSETLRLQLLGGVKWEIWARTGWAPREQTAGAGCSVYSVPISGFPC